MKVLGIIGGMGPQATADLYQKIIDLTPASKDQEHIHVIIDSYAQIPDRTANILHGGEDPAPYLARSAKLLENAGAEALLMPCNTAHYFADSAFSDIKIPLISIVESALSELKRVAPDAKTVIPISTTGTKAGKMYENALARDGYTVLELPQDIQNDIMSAIYDGVKKGRTAEVLPMFQKTLDTIARELKPDAMIAACTEIPILMEHAKSDIPVIDATLALAKAAVDFAK